MKTIGIGGSSTTEQLNKLNNMTETLADISISEYKQRLEKAATLMKQADINAIYLHGGSNLAYFTGLQWGPSERMVGAILSQDNTLHYIGPKFEEGTLRDFMKIEGHLHCWEEHESPYKLFDKLIKSQHPENAIIGMDESTPFFITNGIRLSNIHYRIIDAKVITAQCRMYKSDSEIAIMQTAMDITMEVQKAAARILRPGISAEEVNAFINAAHKACGATEGSYFCIVLFGVDSSYPHGVKHPKPLKEGEVVLIDTGCRLNGYLSDITRTYVFGEPNDRQKRFWDIEKTLQQKAFEAARVGQPCADIDKAVRRELVSHGLGPDYKLPGTSHRTGHGIGLDIHEWPYIVQNEDSLLAKGMTFSIEPMICVPNEFGIRLEDHVYMTETGPRWFTDPSDSIHNPL